MHTVSRWFSLVPCMRAALAALLLYQLCTATASTMAQTVLPSHPVGMKQVEFADATPQGKRHLTLHVFYPADPGAAAGAAQRMTFFTNLKLHRDAGIVVDGRKRPLVMFSHGLGSNGLYYAWFAQYLASRGYIVAALNHHRANTYDSSIVYTRSKLWQRPLDVSKSISFLLQDKAWRSHIDPQRIGIAGHSQGGFTSLWIGGAMVNEEKFLGFQRFWKSNPVLPASLRQEMPLDAAPALNVRDLRIKAAFSMATGDFPGFGMDEAGLAQLKVPAYIIVGEHDKQTPAKEHAAFAARHAPGAQLEVLAGLVDHEIFVNECDQFGRDMMPAACIDAPGVDRAKLHTHIGSKAVAFFDEVLKVQRTDR